MAHTRGENTLPLPDCVSEGFLRFQRINKRLACRRCMGSWRSQMGCLEWCSYAVADLA